MGAEPVLGSPSIYLRYGKQLLVKGEYRRMTMLGADSSLPVGQFVFRTEAASCYFGEAQSGAVGKDVVCRNTYNALVGVDWYPGNDWNFSAQCCHKYTAGSLDGLSVYRHAALATARISKELMRNSLKLPPLPTLTCPMAEFSTASRHPTP